MWRRRRRLLALRRRRRRRWRRARDDVSGRRVAQPDGRLYLALNDDAFNLALLHRELSVGTSTPPPSIVSPHPLYRQQPPPLEPADQILVDGENIDDVDCATMAATTSEWQPPASLFELSHSLSLEARIREAALVLKRAMQLRAPTLIRDRYIQRGGSSVSERASEQARARVRVLIEANTPIQSAHEVVNDAMDGAEMSKWLSDVSIETLVRPTRPFSSLQLRGLWQVLLDNHCISHGEPTDAYRRTLIAMFAVSNDNRFRDRFTLYRWTIDDAHADYYEYRQRLPSSRFLAESALVEAPEPAAFDCPPPPTIGDLHEAIFFLSTLAPDSLFRIVLAKP